MWGEVYEIECRWRRKTLFCMGGTYSVDRQYKHEGFEWFSQELPSPEEYARADRALERCRCRVNHVITHRSTVGSSGYWFKYHIGRIRPQELNWRVVFKRWFFGHFHTDRQLLGRFAVVHDKMIRKL